MRLCPGRESRARALVLALVLCMVPLSAHAQPTSAHDDPAWLLYDQAFERLAAGDEESARVLLETLASEFPDHPAAEQARRRLAEVGQIPAPIPAPEARATRPGVETKTLFARGELALLMTMHGVLAGYRLCGSFDCRGTRATAASTMLGGGLGLGASVYLSRHGLTPGQALVVESGATWGVWNAAALTEFGGEPRDALGMLLGQAAGLGVGVLLARSWRPRAGQVAMANTGGFWAVVLTAMLYGVAGEEPELPVLALASDVGILSGGYLASRMEHISRGRSLLIDAGGLLGVLAGGLVTAVSDPNDESEAFMPILLGTVVGLGLSSYMTRDWDVPPILAGGPIRNATLGVMPMGRGGWGAQLYWQWD